MSDGFPAFTITAGQQVYATGMTLRDYFAGQVISKIAETYSVYAVEAGNKARIAYEFADAMLAARNEEQE